MEVEIESSEEPRPSDSPKRIERAFGYTLAVCLMALLARSVQVQAVWGQNPEKLEAAVHRASGGVIPAGSEKALRKVIRKLRA